MPDQSRSLAAERRQRLRESIERIIAPLYEEAAALDARLEEVEAERQELLAAKRQIAAVIRAADPDRPKHGGARVKGGEPPKRPAHARVGREKLDALLEWLREHNGDYPDGFTSLDLREAEGIPVPKGTITFAVAALRERGDLRLDGVRRGGQGTPPRIYKLVEA
jgi:hypothetical protein